MSVDVARLRPGHILVCRGTSQIDKLIETGAVRRGLPAFSHVAGYHHRTGKVLWGIEGRPGGVGWVDLAKYLNDPGTVANTGQPLTDAQAAMVCGTALGLVGTPYDWQAIYEDANRDLGLPALWQEQWTGEQPAHVVCSSLYAYVYDKAGLPAPDGDEPHVEPADWGRFIEQQAWKRQ